MLELGFEGKRCSLRGKLEKGLPDRVNSGEGLETETVWKWGHVGPVWKSSPWLGQKIRCQWREAGRAAGASGASSARVLNCAGQPGA